MEEHLLPFYQLSDNKAKVFKILPNKILDEKALEDFDICVESILETSIEGWTKHGLEPFLDMSDSRFDIPLDFQLGATDAHVLRNVAIVSSVTKAKFRGWYLINTEDIVSGVKHVFDPYFHFENWMDFLSMIGTCSLNASLSASDYFDEMYPVDFIIEEYEDAMEDGEMDDFCPYENMVCHVKKYYKAGIEHLSPQKIKNLRMCKHHKAELLIMWLSSHLILKEKRKAKLKKVKFMRELKRKLVKRAKFRLGQKNARVGKKSICLFRKLTTTSSLCPLLSTLETRLQNSSFFLETPLSSNANSHSHAPPDIKTPSQKTHADCIGHSFPPHQETKSPNSFFHVAHSSTDVMFSSTLLS